MFEYNFGSALVSKFYLGIALLYNLVCSSAPRPEKCLLSQGMQHAKPVILSVTPVLTVNQPTQTCSRSVSDPGRPISCFNSTFTIRNAVFCKLRTPRTIHFMEHERS